jgi:hypothetical protein
MLQIIGFYIN